MARITNIVFGIIHQGAALNTQLIPQRAAPNFFLDYNVKSKYGGSMTIIDTLKQCHSGVVVY